MKLLKESDTRTVDPSNLTTEQLKELNVRMAQFIEDVRTKFGTFSPTMVRVSEESVNLSKLIGETYKMLFVKLQATQILLYGTQLKWVI